MASMRNPPHASVLRTGTHTNEGSAGFRMALQDGRSCHSMYRQPSAEIVVHPEDKYSYRYESEKRFQGTLSVTIRVNDYEGPVKAVLACVTEGDEPPKFQPWPHPNKLVCPTRRTKCKDGVCTIERIYITKKNNLIKFNQIGIIRVLKRDAQKAMRERISDTDYPYARDCNEAIKAVTSIEMTSVRLACQVLIQDAEGALTNPLKPAVTTRVTHYPEKLQILDASHDRGYATGGLRVFLFTAKLPDSVVVVFRERDSAWRAQGAAVRQHKKVALQFTTPRYHTDYELLEPVKVYYYVAESMDTADEQPADDNRRDFTYLPVTDEKVLEDKLKKRANKTAWNVFTGVLSAAAAAVAGPSTAAMAPIHQHGGGGGTLSAAAAAMAPTHQHGGGGGTLSAAAAAMAPTHQHGGGGGTLSAAAAASAPTHQHGGGGGTLSAAAAAPTHQHGVGTLSSAVAVWDAPTHQHQVGPTDYVAIPTSELGEPYIPESQHAQHDVRPTTPDLLDYVMQLESQEVDAIARNLLSQPRSMPVWFLDEPMDQDMAGSEDLPG